MDLLIQPHFGDYSPWHGSDLLWAGACIRDTFIKMNIKYRPIDHPWNINVVRVIFPPTAGPGFLCLTGSAFFFLDTPGPVPRPSSFFYSQPVNISCFGDISHRRKCPFYETCRSLFAFFIMVFWQMDLSLICDGLINGN